MLGSDKSRGYCLEMICTDFLAGANLDNGNPEILLNTSNSEQPDRQIPPVSAFLLRGIDLLGIYRMEARVSAFWQGSDSIWINTKELGVLPRPE